MIIYIIVLFIFFFIGLLIGITFKKCVPIQYIENDFNNQQQEYDLMEKYGELFEKI